MKRLLAALAAIWHAEPVLVAALVPVLTTAGLTAADARSIQSAATGIGALVAEAVAAFGVRAKVKPTAVKPTPPTAPKS